MAKLIDSVKAAYEAAKLNFSLSGKRGQVSSRADDAIDRWYYAEPAGNEALIGAGRVQARHRRDIYGMYQQMMADPIVSAALRLHVTAALGGHETSGDLVFIEPSAQARTDKKAQNIAKELTDDLGVIFNRIAYSLAYNGAGFGDAYGRIYFTKGRGVREVSVDEMMLPPLVQPYEVGSRTVACIVSVGERTRERLLMNQIVRMRMPRMAYTPQPLAIEKAWRSAILTDELDELLPMPALVGGSFLADAERKYLDYAAAMMGLVGQRVLDSIDETMFAVNVKGTNKEQRRLLLETWTKLLQRSKERIDAAVKSGSPVLERMRHLIPTWDEKQVVQVQSMNLGAQGGRAGSVSIDDVLLHAKMLAGALGTDITMIGFADMMTGGLGEGGFFRTSAQTAERSRVIRQALTEALNHVADVHLMYKHGHTYTEQTRPWQINFFGSISALETERQKTQLDAINTGQLMVAVMRDLRDLNLDEATLEHYLERVLKLDTADAKMYAKAIRKASEEAAAKEAGGGFGGGFPGGMPPDPEAPAYGTAH